MTESEINVGTAASMGKSGYKFLWRSSKQNVASTGNTASQSNEKSAPTIQSTVSSHNTNKNSEGWQNIINLPSTAINSTVSSGSWNGHLSQRWRTNFASAYRRCITDTKPLSRPLTGHGRFCRSLLREKEGRNR